MRRARRRRSRRSPSSPRRWTRSSPGEHRLRQPSPRGAARAPRPRGTLRAAWPPGSTLPVLMLLPAMVIIVGLVGYPLVTDDLTCRSPTRGLGDLINGDEPTVGGPANYKEVFTDEHLRTSLVNTVVFGTRIRDRHRCVFGMAVALLLNERLKRSTGPLLARRAAAVGGARDRRSCDLQVALRRPATASSTGRWSTLGFDSLPGLRLVRRPLQRLRGDLHTVVVWQSFPFIALSLLAGLQTLCRRRRSQAAAVDGAGPCPALPAW